jgi:hypothetical protein
VVKGDALNRSRIATVVCVPLTSNLKWVDAPGNVLLTARSTSLPKNSVANVSQIVALDRAFLTERTFSIPLRISPTVTTLRRRASESNAANQSRTRAFARAPLRSSAMTLVSSRNFTTGSSVRNLSIARNRRHRPGSACPTGRLTAYLLNMSHKRGATKARLLLSVGNRSDAPQVLESDLRAQHLSLDVTRTSENAYGVVYEIEGLIRHSPPRRRTAG